MEKEKFEAEINATMQELISLVDTVDDDQFNEVPFEGSWTAGQLAEHVVLSVSGFLQVVNGPVKDSDKAPDQMVAKIKADFLNFNTKMKSPDMIVPAMKVYNKAEMINTLNGLQKGLDEAIKKLDLGKTCASFELPVYGFLTRLEALSFVLYHTQRHVHQLKNIQQRLLAA